MTKRIRLIGSPSNLPIISDYDEQTGVATIDLWWRTATPPIPENLTPYREISIGDKKYLVGQEKQPTIEPQVYVEGEILKSSGSEYIVRRVSDPKEQGDLELKLQEQGFTGRRFWKGEHPLGELVETKD